jgi:hypothetical protein
LFPITPVIGSSPPASDPVSPGEDRLPAMPGKTDQSDGGKTKGRSPLVCPCGRRTLYPATGVSRSESNHTQTGNGVVVQTHTGRRGETGIQTKVTEIARDTHRISTLHPDFGIQFNQFIIRDDEPFLMHTGYRGMFQATLEGVKSIIDPDTDSTLHRLAALKPAALAVMHGSSFRGDSEMAILGLALAVKDLLS